MKTKIKNTVDILTTPLKGLYNLAASVNLDDYKLLLKSKKEDKTYTINASEFLSASSVTGTPEEIAYFDDNGVITSDAGLKRVANIGTLMKVEDGSGVFAFTNTGYEDSDYFEAAYVNGSNKGKVIIVSRDFGEEPETVFGTAGFQIEKSSTGLGIIQHTGIGDKRQEIGFELGNSQVPKIKMADYEDYNNGTNSVGVEITFSEGTFKVSPHEDSTSGDMVQIYSKTGQLILGITKEGALRMEALTTYADDAAADADTDLASKCLYKVTGDRTVYQKP